MYKEVYEMCRNTERVMGLFSKELQIMDRNTVQFMIDEMQDTIDNQAAQLAQKAEQLSQKDEQLSQKNEKLSRQKLVIREQEAEIAKLKKLLTEREHKD